MVGLVNIRFQSVEREAGIPIRELCLPDFWPVINAVGETLRSNFKVANVWGISLETEQQDSF